MKVLIIIVCSILGLSSAWAESNLSLYRTCMNSTQQEIKLYASQLNSTTRPSVFIFGDAAVLGHSNSQLTQFISDDGQYKVQFIVDSSGTVRNAKVVNRQRTYTFNRCYQHDEGGGGSVSAHN